MCFFESTHFSIYKSNTCFPRILNRDCSAFPTHISNTGYILLFSLHIRTENFPRIYTATLSRSVALYTHTHTHTHTHTSIYIYTVCAVILPIAKNISWGKENIVPCPPSLFMIPQRHNTCRPMQEPASTNHVHRTNSWSSFSMLITWYTDVSECKGREFCVCRNSVWNATYVKYQNSVGSWISTMLDQREDMMSWPKYFVCSKERSTVLQCTDSVFIQGCLIEGMRIRNFVTYFTIQSFAICGVEYTKIFEVEVLKYSWKSNT